MCISKKAPNSIRAFAKINFAIDNVNTTYGTPLYNPLLKNIEIQKYGSNMLRKKLLHVAKLDLSAGRLQQPIVKGHGFKERSVGRVDKKTEIKSAKKRLRDRVMKYD
mgnify:CR=1 FL=1